MAVGPAIRRFLGPRIARLAGLWYRALFVDLAQVAVALAAVLPRGAHLLDVGGGDGQPLNHLLALRPDLTITTLDPAPFVGQWIEERFAGQVTRMPATTLADYVSRGQRSPDALLIADVMHHIPKSARRGFLDSIKVLLDRQPALRIIVKDVEPGHWRAVLGYWSDRYVTGDRNVSLISIDDLTRLFEEALGPLHCVDTHLLEKDRPNYVLAFHR
jgi:hypothetical protein